MSEIKGNHDKRVNIEYQTGSYSETDYNTAFKCLNRARKRMSYTLPGSTGLESFKSALDSADDVEIFTVWERGDVEENRCIVKNLKDSWQQDTKYISGMLDKGFKTGNTITWKRLGIRWLLVWQDFNYKDYYRGEMYRANHLVRWIDDTGRVCEQWASVRGPVETKAKYDNVSGNYMGGRQNDTLDLWIGNNNEKIKDLYRYELIKIGNRTWRIQVIDDISNPDVLRMSLIENFNNVDTDDVILGIPEGQIIMPEETIPSPENYNIVGSTTVKEMLPASYKAYDAKGLLVKGDWKATRDGKVIKTATDVSEFEITGNKMGEFTIVTFSITGETKAEVQIKTVSIFS